MESTLDNWGTLRTMRSFSRSSRRSGGIAIALLCRVEDSFASSVMCACRGGGLGDTVLDPFCGTGTTILAAMRANRNSIGVEIDPEYCQSALGRLHREGPTLFDEVEIGFERRPEVTDARTEVAPATA